MNDCYYCAWRNGAHDPNCPEGEDPRWVEGFSDGRNDRPAKHDEPVYNLGYGRGVVALEEAQNGFHPIHEGRQW